MDAAIVAAPNIVVGTLLAAAFIGDSVQFTYCVRLVDRSRSIGQSDVRRSTATSHRGQ
jgi:hypothetical protein